MKAISSKRHRSGYVSLLVVLSVATLLTLLTVAAYKRASDAHSVQTKTQLRVDYAEKEESILRSVLTITPNRAIRAMQGGSDTTAVRPALTWQRIFGDALDLANARSSVSAAMRTTINAPGLQVSNTGDSALGNPATIFTSIIEAEGLVSAGINRNPNDFELGKPFEGYPASLTCNHNTTNTRDALYPIISNKKYDSLAPATFGPQFENRTKFNLLKYPKINFGYAKPGEDFVAKRNWWAFSMDVSANDALLTRVASTKRDYVLSIYEVPSQLAISAASFMSLGKYASGDAWQNVTIDGGMFVGTAEVSAGGTTGYDSLSSRRRMTLESGTAIGGENFTNDPFAEGVREAYQVNPDNILPVSLASESGHATFIPISRGKEMIGNQAVYPFFDRFANAAETNVLSSTNWNDYSSGAMQCAMRLTVTKVVSAINQTPTMLEFEYFPAGSATRVKMDMPLDTGFYTSLPPGYVEVCWENETPPAFLVPVDIAYGINNGTGNTGFTFRQGLTGTIRFDNDTFGDPIVGQRKKGYIRPPAGLGYLKNLTISSDPVAPRQVCLAIYPERMPAFLAAIGGASTETNHSLVVNVDYTNTRGYPAANVPKRPQIDPCRDIDYGLVLQECANLTGFTRGFSLVSNLRLYFGDDFNVVPVAPPTGYTPAVTATNPTGRFLPPCSLFAPEKRYGVDVTPFGVSLSGQIGSLAQGDRVNTADTVKNVRPLDSKTMTGTAIASDRIEVNLSPLLHPAELPPITMMNWLVLLEERRSEYY